MQAIPGLLKHFTWICVNENFYSSMCVRVHFVSLVMLSMLENGKEGFVLQITLIQLV